MKAAAGVVALVLAATACGGGGGVRLSKSDFQAKGNAICAKYNQKIKQALSNVGNDPNELADAMERAISYIKHGTTALDALKPPHEYDTKFERFSRINHVEIAEGQRLAAAARRNDRTAVRTVLARLESQGNEADELANDMGLDTCASG